MHPAAGIISIVEDRGALERRPKPSSRGVPAACGEGTLDRDYSRPISRNAAALGGYSFYFNVENKCLIQPDTESITVTHIFKKRVEFDTAKKRASHAAAESFYVYLGSQIVSICSDSGGSGNVYHLTGCLRVA